MGEPFDSVVLDFDGTFTEVEKEAEPFLAGYVRDLIAELGPDAEAAWADAEATVRRTPGAFGWEFEGRIVAPSNADPYIRATSTAQIVLERFGFAPDRRADLMQRLYRTHYAKSDVVFRPEARATLEALLAGPARVFVVTNSYTDAVQQKLAKLGPKHLDRLTVFGDAKKYVITSPEAPDPRFDALPETIRVEGLPRPMYLRRGHYFDVLRRIWSTTGATPDRTLLCGDIFELDLAMPAHLGVHIELVTRPGTAPYEVEATQSFPRGHVSTRLDALLDRVPS